MFSSLDSSVLGKKNCGCTKGFSYTPSIIHPMDVEFVLIKNTSGTINYIPLIENGNENTVIPSELKIDEKAMDEPYEENKKKDIYSLNNDYINTFYIGSVTVIGLYILFRMINKTK